MAILTGKPSSVVAGTPSSTITLSRSTLISQMSITDPYWSVSTNWSSVSFIYLDATGSEKFAMVFLGPNTSIFDVSSTARTNGWQVSQIMLADYDNGSYIIPRASFTSAAEFDITVSPVAPVLVTPQYHWDPALANGGTGPYTDNTTANGTLYTEILAANNATLTASGTTKYKGVGSGANPYRLEDLTGSGAQMDLVSTVAAPANYQAMQFWGNLSSFNYQSIGAFTGGDFCSMISGSPATTYFFDANGTPNTGANNTFTSISYGSPTGAWHLYTITRDLAGNNIIMVDGVTDTTKFAANVNPTQFLRPFGQFRGAIGDIWHFNVEVTNADALAYYNATKATYGL